MFDDEDVETILNQPCEISKWARALRDECANLARHLVARLVRSLVRRKAWGELVDNPLDVQQTSRLREHASAHQGGGEGVAVRVLKVGDARALEEDGWLGE